MRTKIGILLFIAIAIVHAQVPSPNLWWAAGDSLYPIVNNIWVKGDSIHFDFASFDSLSGVNLDSLGKMQIDTLTVNDTLNVGGSGIVENNLTVEDTTFCDYYKGLSPIYFLSDVHVRKAYIDSIESTYQTAPSFSGTDFTNTQGYWDIIAGPDSLDWTEQSNVVAGTSRSEMQADADTLYSISISGNSLHISLRDPDTGVWSSVASKSISSGGSMCDFVLGGGDSIHVVWDDGNGVYYSCWNGSSWVNDHTILTTTYHGYAVSIARHTDGTIYALGALSSMLYCYEYSGGAWTAPDTLSTSNIHSDGWRIMVAPNGVAHAIGPNDGASLCYSFEDNGGTVWDATSIRVGTAGTMGVNDNGDLWAAIEYGSNIYMYKNIGTGWVAQDTISTSAISSSYRLDITFDNTNNPHLVYYDPIASGIKYLYWDGSHMISNPTFSMAGRSFPSIAFFGSTLAIMGTDGANEDVFLQKPDPGHNTGHRDGALLIRANLQNDAADIYIQTDSSVHINSDTLKVSGLMKVINAIFSGWIEVDSIDVDHIRLSDNILGSAAFGILDSLNVSHVVANETIQLPGKLTAGTKITEVKDAEANVCYWSGSITHDSVTAAAVAEDILLIDDFPAKYKILEIMVDVTELWGGGLMSACTISAGWTGSAYDDLIATQDIHSSTVLIGDASGELNYTAIQGGIRASWSSTQDIYLRFVATDDNLSSLTTGEMTVYITYQIF